VIAPMTAMMMAAMRLPPRRTIASAVVGVVLTR